jgi:hypothetical protein
MLAMGRSRPDWSQKPQDPSILSIYYLFILPCPYRTEPYRTIAYRSVPYRTVLYRFPRETVLVDREAYRSFLTVFRDFCLKARTLPRFKFYRSAV